MGQDWKTLSLVVIVAAIAGWWVVRALDGRDSAPAPLPAATASAPEPVETAEPVAEAQPVAATPAVTARPGEIPAVVNEEAEVAAIQRDLDQLRQALARDQRIEDSVMPRVNDGLDVPGVVTYRRAPEFWESALATPKEEKP
jgi:hypothetical protein